MPLRSMHRLKLGHKRHSVQPPDDASSNVLYEELKTERKLELLLTGSTGNYGAYLLDELLQQTQVSKVVCLNRSSDAYEKQISANAARGLTTEFDHERVEFLQADLSNQALGLQEETYWRLASSVDLVIHNAWPVDFNRSFGSFKPSIDSVMNLINFCVSAAKSAVPSEGAASQDETSTSKRPIAMMFVSSIGVTSNWSSAAVPSRSQVPEELLMDWKFARTGYGQSKLVSERLIAYATSKLPLRSCIVRVGQLSGPALRGLQGKWTEREWFPSLLRSSFILKALPRTLGPLNDVDWVPVDLAAQVFVEIAMDQMLPGRLNGTERKKQTKQPTPVFHIVNPKRSKYSELVRAIRYRMPAGTRTVDLASWVDILKASIETAGGYDSVDEGKNPAAKLIDFFDNLQDKAIRFPYTQATQLETKKTALISPTLAGLERVGAEWMELWLRQWNWDGRTEEQAVFPSTLRRGHRALRKDRRSVAALETRAAQKGLLRLPSLELHRALSWERVPSE